MRFLSEIFEKAYFYVKDYENSDAAYRACQEKAGFTEIMFSHEKRAWFYYLPIFK